MALPTLEAEWYSKNRVDAVYIATSEQLGDPLLTKFTGISQTDFSFWYVQTPRTTRLLCGTLEEGAVRQRYKGNLHVIQSRKDIVMQLKPFFAQKRVGLNFAYLTAIQVQRLKDTFPTTKWVDVSEALQEARAIKTNEEMKKIREAVKVTQETIRKIPGMVKQGMTEVQLAAEINHHFSRAGCGVAFPTIVGFGKNSRNIHHFNGNTKLRTGNNVLIDCGAKYEGYCADLSRTFVFKKGDEEQHAMYAKVVAAQTAAFAHVGPGKMAKDVQRMAEEIVGHKIPHALGHGLGLETHDVPGGIHAKAEWSFRTGMVVAVEPGYYGKKWGIRVEDDGIVTRSGVERLSMAPKKLVEL